MGLTKEAELRDFSGATEAKEIISPIMSRLMDVRMWDPRRFPNADPEKVAVAEKYLDNFGLRQEIEGMGQRSGEDVYNNGFLLKMANIAFFAAGLAKEGAYDRAGFDVQMADWFSSQQGRQNIPRMRAKWQNDVTRSGILTAFKFTQTIPFVNQAETYLAETPHPKVFSRPKRYPNVRRYMNRQTDASRPVIDFGSGTGEFLLSIANRFGSCIGVEALPLKKIFPDKNMYTYRWNSKAGQRDPEYVMNQTMNHVLRRLKEKNIQLIQRDLFDAELYENLSRIVTNPILVYANSIYAHMHSSRVQKALELGLSLDPSIVIVGGTSTGLDYKNPTTEAWQTRGGFFVFSFEEGTKLKKFIQEPD